MTLEREFRRVDTKTTIPVVINKKCGFQIQYAAENEATQLSKIPRLQQTRVSFGLAVSVIC